MNQGLWEQSCPSRLERPAPGSEPPCPPGLEAYRGAFGQKGRREVLMVALPDGTVPVR